MLGCGAMARAFAARIAVRLMLFWTLPVSALPVAAAPATRQLALQEPRITSCSPLTARQDRLCSATWGSATPVLAPSEGSFLDAKRGRTWMRFDNPTQAGPALPRRGPNGSQRQPIAHHIQPRGPILGASGQKQRGRRNRKSYFIPTQTRDVVPQEGELDRSWG
jgi:hypothetical protein